MLPHSTFLDRLNMNSETLLGRCPPSSEKHPMAPQPLGLSPHSPREPERPHHTLPPSHIPILPALGKNRLLSTLCLCLCYFCHHPTYSSRPGCSPSSSSLPDNSHHLHHAPVVPPTGQMEGVRSASITDLRKCLFVTTPPTSPFLCEDPGIENKTQKYPLPFLKSIRQQFTPSTQGWVCGALKCVWACLLLSILLGFSRQGFLRQMHVGQSVPLPGGPGGLARCISQLGSPPKPFLLSPRIGPKGGNLI